MAFERIKWRDGRGYRYLVENKRVNGKVVQKVIRYLGVVKSAIFHIH